MPRKRSVDNSSKYYKGKHTDSCIRDAKLFGQVVQDCRRKLQGFAMR